MKCSVAVLAAALASVASCVAGPSELEGVVLGESFSLKIGESVKIEGEALQIGFEDVPADSRCPKGERCIWEGDATVQVWLEKAPCPKERHELHTSSKEQSAVSCLSYGVTLLRLDPYPVSGRTIARGHYRATLEVVLGSSTSPNSH